MFLEEGPMEAKVRWMRRPLWAGVTVFTCFHLILNEAATLNYACRRRSPIKNKGREWKDTQADAQELFGPCLLESCMYDGVRPPLSPRLKPIADLESI